MINPIKAIGARLRNSVSLTRRGGASAEVSERQQEQIRLLIGKVLSEEVKAHGIYEILQDAEFSVFSQFGDDGILQYLVHQCSPENRTFIEFGVETYQEANTRFLLMNDNWRGLVIDSDPKAMSALREDEIYWRHDLTAVSAFITRENINQLFLDNGFGGRIGVLSIDIDGNDFWIWEAIDAVDPVIVTIEYNGIFGSEHAVTIPYEPNFHRTHAHFSNLYWGASIKALCNLAEKKGYAFVGCNSAGNNAHFVRDDHLGLLPSKKPAEAFVEPKFRESRDQTGRLTFLRGSERLRAIRDMFVLETESQDRVRIGDLFGLS